MPKDDYAIKCGSENMDTARIHAFLSQTYWAKGVSREVVAVSVQNSLCVGVFYQGEQIGFARLITDRATFAYLADVYVEGSHRGKGLCRRMLDDLFRHPDIQNVRRIALATDDAQGLYEKYGFQRVERPERQMELRNPGGGFGTPAPRCDNP